MLPRKVPRKRKTKKEYERVNDDDDDEDGPTPTKKPRRREYTHPLLLQGTSLTLPAGQRKTKVEEDIDVPQPETLEEVEEYMASVEDVKPKREDFI